MTQTVTGTWTSGGFVEIDPINMPGLYRFDIPDTVFASSASAIQIINTAGRAQQLVKQVVLSPIQLQILFESL